MGLPSPLRSAATITVINWLSLVVLVARFIMVEELDIWNCGNGTGKSNRADVCQHGPRSHLNWKYPRILPRSTIHDTRIELLYGYIATIVLLISKYVWCEAKVDFEMIFYHTLGCKQKLDRCDADVALCRQVWEHAATRSDWVPSGAFPGWKAFQSSGKSLRASNNIDPPIESWRWADWFAAVRNLSPPSDAV